MAGGSGKSCKIMLTHAATGALKCRASTPWQAMASWAVCVWMQRVLKLCRCSACSGWSHQGRGGEGGKQEQEAGQRVHHVARAGDGHCMATRGEGVLSPPITSAQD